MLSKTVVFVHGMFVTPRCWRDWHGRFEARGYQTHAPAWPEHEAPASERRKSADDNPALAALTLEALLDHHRRFLATLPEPPALVGHSMGGLLVQLLLQDGLGWAGVAIDSAPPNGVVSLKWSFLKSNFPSLDPFANLDRPYLMDLDAFRYGFANTLEPDAQRAAYEEHVVPDSRRVWKAPSGAASRIDFARDRPPLLMIAGELDHIIPASLNRANADRYRKGPARTDFVELPGRDHFLIGAPGWEEVADHAGDWLDAIAAGAAPLSREG